MQQLLSNLVIIIGLIFYVFGTAGLFRFKNLYTRALLTSNGDTVGFVTVLVGIMIGHGFSFFSAKILLILVVSLCVNPLATGLIINSAQKSGFVLEDEQ